MTNGKLERKMKINLKFVRHAATFSLAYVRTYVRKCRCKRTCTYALFVWSVGHLIEFVFSTNLFVVLIRTFYVIVGSSCILADVERSFDLRIFASHFFSKPFYLNVYMYVRGYN